MGYRSIQLILNCCRRVIIDAPVDFGWGAICVGLRATGFCWDVFAQFGRVSCCSGFDSRENDRPAPVRPSVGSPGSRRPWSAAFVLLLSAPRKALEGFPGPRRLLACPHARKPSPTPVGLQGGPAKRPFLFLLQGALQALPPGWCSEPLCIRSIRSSIRTSRAGLPESDRDCRTDPRRSSTPGG